MLRTDIIKVAKFKFENSFQLSGRGLVITGQITDGSIKPGNSIYLEDDNNVSIIKVSGVEQGIIGKDGFVGLHVETADINIENKLKRQIGRVLIIMS